MGLPLRYRAELTPRQADLSSASTRPLDPRLGVGVEGTLHRKPACWYPEVIYIQATREWAVIDHLSEKKQWFGVDLSLP